MNGTVFDLMAVMLTIWLMRQPNRNGVCSIVYHAIQTAQIQIQRVDVL